MKIAIKSRYFTAVGPIKKSTKYKGALSVMETDFVLQKGGVGDCREEGIAK